MCKVVIALIFCFAHLTFSAVDGGQCRGERSQRGFALLNTKYSSIAVQNFRDCVGLCLEDVRCMSFNFWWDTKDCDLNSNARESYQTSFVQAPASIYMGMGRVSVFPKSCSSLKNLDPTAESGSYVIDPDGKGGLPPLYDVICNMSDKNGAGVTIISHDTEDRKQVQGCEDPGCYSREIHYTGASLSQLANLARVSSHCEQFIKYECYNSKFFGKKVNAWWVSRDSTNMTYWDGASLSNKCACGMNKSCVYSRLACNCDANDNVWREDSGLLTDKTKLPVKQLRFGDTGEGEEKGYHTLGKFKCYGTA